jgi:hypothetical protein
LVLGNFRQNGSKKYIVYTIRRMTILSLSLTCIFSNISEMDTTTPANAGEPLPSSNCETGSGSEAGSAPPTNTTPHSASILGNVYKQCSIARSAASTLTVTEVMPGNITTKLAPAPQIGSLDWEGDLSAKKTFHGGRVSKAGRTVNECVSSSFDPRNLHCVGCETPHHILNSLKIPVLIFSDQNFVPFLNGGPENCVAVFRAENSSLSELADLAAEVLEKTLLPSGTVLLFGSGSHLFRSGPSQYATDWIHLRNRCSQKWPGSNICPLIPLVRSDCPGSLARDISILSSWLCGIYSDNACGLLDTWNSLRTYTESHCEGNQHTEVCKIPLPSSISAGSVQTHCFIFHGSCPVTLPGVHRKATEELLRVLIENLNRDFETNLNPEIILLNNWAGDNSCTDSNVDMEAAESGNHVILVGASNMRRLLPFLKSTGISVTDLTQPSWLATPENIDYLASKLNTIVPEKNSIVILELFGNSTYRYRQFDGTMALPFKYNNGYHLEGDVGVCDDASFTRLCTMLDPVFDACGKSVKIVIPPLPRHLYTGCCSNKKHCTNIKNEDYELSLLQATTHFRPVLKECLLKQGVDRFFVVDGVGALLGVPPGGNRGAPVEILRELSSYCAADGVHYTEVGYSNLAKTIVEAARGVSDGTLTKTRSEDKNCISGKSGTNSYFWRGFCSPVGARLSVTAVTAPAIRGPPANTQHFQPEPAYKQVRGRLPPGGHGGHQYGGHQRGKGGRGRRPYKYHHYQQYYPY